MVPFLIWRWPSSGEALTCISSMWRSMLSRVRVCSLWSALPSNCMSASGTCAAMAASSDKFSSRASLSCSPLSAAYIEDNINPRNRGYMRAEIIRLIARLLICVVQLSPINSTLVCEWVTVATQLTLSAGCSENRFLSEERTLFRDSLISCFWERKAKLTLNQSKHEVPLNPSKQDW